MSPAWTRGLFWTTVLGLLLLLIHRLSGILLPFAVGAGVAFFLDPVVDRLARWRIPRSLGAVAALAGLTAILVGFGLLLAPLIQAEVMQLVGRMPAYVQFGRGLLDRLFALAQDKLSPDDLARLREAASAQLGDYMTAVARVVTSLLTGGIAVANVLSLIFITPVVAFFLLRDWPVIVRTLDGWLPRQHVGTIRQQARLVEATLSGFMRGQALVCLLFGVYYAVGMTLVGLDFSLVLGFITGFLIFIPFLGALSGAALAILLAAAQFGDWHAPLEIAILYGIGQTVEGNVVTPKLVGDRVNLHPVWIIFALLAFGSIFGFLGVVLAVPVAAVLGVFLRFLIGRYLASPLYDPANERLPGT